MSRCRAGRGPPIGPGGSGLRLTLPTDPLLVDVGQEDAVLLVEVVVQGVVPVLGLHQAGDQRRATTQIGFTLFV